MKVVLAIWLLICPTTLVAATWYVHPGGAGDATTVQAGVDLSSHGDTVLVAPGTYADTTTMLVDGVYRTVTLHLTKDIVLIAEGDTSNTTIGGPDSDVAIFAEGVGPTGRIEGLRIESLFAPYGCAARTDANTEDIVESASAMAGDQFGLYCINSSLSIVSCFIENTRTSAFLLGSPITLTDCLIQWSLIGIDCNGGSDAIIANNRILRLGGAIIATSSNPSIVDNHIGGGNAQMCGAVDCDPGTSPYIARNYFDHIRPTAIIVGSAEPIIEDNYFAEGLTAIYLSVGTEIPVIRNNIFYDHGSWIIDIRKGQPIIERNTIDLNTDSDGIVIQNDAVPTISHNVITRCVGGIVCLAQSSAVIECNNIFDTDFPYAQNCPDQTGINGNISVDPQFCGTWDSGNWFLQSDSPCAPGNHPDGYNCGQIGARGVDCSTTPVRQLNWGGIKALFHRKGKTK